uniref:BURP domain-containing protein n=1 Tax=Salix viminalis TaxID=40686 RepID=A0A6N2L0A9_SALVM
MMRTTAVILVLGLTFLNLQVDAKRLVFKEITAEKTDKQPLSNVQQGDAGTDIKPNTQGKASTYSNPVTGSVPAVDTKNDNATSSPTTTMAVLMMRPTAVMETMAILLDHLLKPIIPSPMTVSLRKAVDQL